MPNKIPWKSMINDWQLDERKKKNLYFLLVNFGGNNGLSQYLEDQREKKENESQYTGKDDSK